MTTNFKSYIQSFSEDDSPLGDLSRDIFQDSCFPDTNDQKHLESYLESLNSCNDARVTLKKALSLFYKSMQPIAGTCYSPGFE